MSRHGLEAGPRRSRFFQHWGVQADEPVAEREKEGRVTFP